MKAHRLEQRLRRHHPPSYKRLKQRLARGARGNTPSPQAIHCGWGRLLLGQTYPDAQTLAQALLEEDRGERDIALYVAAPQQVLAYAPQQLFLDPSDTLRVNFSDYRQAKRAFRGFRIRRASSSADWQGLNALYSQHKMLSVDPERLTPAEDGGPTYWLAEDSHSGAIIGGVMGLDHHKAFADPEQGCSLWCLAVDADCRRPGVGESLVRHLIEHYQSRGRHHLDLSVLHTNSLAKRLYDKLGFRELPTFALKRKNGFNEPLFVGPGDYDALNPYARIIVDEALRRGIAVDVADAQSGLFTLTHGGRQVRCRESLSDLTSAVSMTLCQDKTLTHRCLARAGLKQPAQRLASDTVRNHTFLAEHGAVVVKPANGEQGQGVAVDIRTTAALQQAIDNARQFDSNVVLESYHAGYDLRVLVIGYEVVAAAVRHPAQIIGDGQHSIEALIETQSRRRQAATGGESRIPLDDETERTLGAAGYRLDSILPAGQHLTVRKTANLHTGGHLEDVTASLHPALAEAAVQAARALQIPMVGIDLLVPDAQGPDYVIIEANERAGLANHAPQPTAERFIDLLFPHSADTLPSKE